MPTKALDDPILKRFRAAVTKIYGDRVARVMLFGSRVRGEAQPDSDYDVAVFLNDMRPFCGDEPARRCRHRYSFIHAMPFRADAG